MPLLSLPAEIILLIFRYVGRRHLKRRKLYISKAWYTYAKPTFIRTINITSTQLPYFPLKDDVIQSHTKFIYLNFADLFANWDWPEYQPLDGPIPEILTPEWVRKLCPGDDKSENIGELSEILGSNISNFAAAITTLKRLKKLSFVAFPESAAIFESTGKARPYRVKFHVDRFNYLLEEPIYTLVLSLPAQTLTSLTLDMFGSRLMSDANDAFKHSGVGAYKRHICPMLKDLVMLRVLKVRMAIICEDVFLIASESSRIKKIYICIARQDKSCWTRGFCELCYWGPDASPSRNVLGVLVKAGGEAMKRCKRLKKCVVFSAWDRDYDGKLQSSDTSDYGLTKVNCSTGKMSWALGSRGIESRGYWNFDSCDDASFGTVTSFNAATYVDIDADVYGWDWSFTPQRVNFIK